MAFLFMLIVVLAAYLIIAPAVALILVIRLRREQAILSARLEALSKAQAGAANASPAASTPAPATSPAIALATVPPICDDEGIDRLRRCVSGIDFGEVSMMKWWLPRVGGALAVLAAVFFGVYGNRNMPPPYRLLEMIGVCAAFLLGGMLLERTLRAFGGVVVMVGVVMTYLTSFAAYAFPPVRVITDPKTGAVLQALVLALIVLLGLARRSRGVVMAAFIMAWPMMFFMVYTKVGDVLLISAAMMCVAGVLMPILHERFSLVPWLALPLGGASMILLGVYLDIAATHNAAAAFCYLAVIALAVPLAGISDKWKVPAPRSLAAASCALAGIAAYVYFDNFFAALTGKAYLVVAGASLAGAVVQWTKGRWSPIALQYAVKTSAFVSLWIITDYAEYTRWAALLVQTAALGIMGRREKKTSLLITAAVTAIVSIAYFLGDSRTAPLYMSQEWWFAAAYPVGLMTALAWMLATHVPALDEPDRRTTFSVSTAVIVSLLALPLEMREPMIAAHSHASMLVVGAAMLALAFVPGISRLAMSCAAATCLTIASVLFCKKPDSPATLAAILLACAGIAASAQLRNWIQSGIVREAAKLAAFAIAVCTTSAWLNGSYEYTQWTVAALAAAALGFVALSRLRGMDTLRLVTLLAPLFILHSGFDYNLLSLVLAPVWLLAVAYLRTDGDDRRTIESVCATLAGLWLLMLALDSRRYIFEMHNGAVCCWIALGGMTLTAIAKDRRLRGAGLAGLAVVAAALINIHLYHRFHFEDASDYHSSIAAALLIGMTLPVYSEFMRRRNGLDWVNVEKLIPLLMPVLTWAAFALPVVARQVVPESWDTPLMALNSCALVVFGIIVRSRPYRLTGLVTLLIPAYRLFVYDLDEPLQRIAAFGIGGILIMCLGYLYHRLSPYMARTGESGTDAKSLPK